MYKIIKVVIESKRYELKEMLTKIDTFWVQGQLSEEEHTELVALARTNALPENSYASIQEQIDTLFKKVAEGVKYICIAPEGVAVVWDPDAMPTYWQEVTEESDDQSTV